MSTPTLDAEIADQAKIVRRLQRAARKSATAQTYRDAMLAEAHLDRLLARKDGKPDQEPLFAEGGEW